MTMIVKEKRFYEKKGKWSILMCACAFAICLIYAGALCNKTFPPTEGWYSYYAYLINEEGAIPYIDFELLFPPLYTYLIALFTRVFGYGIFPLRIFGVLVFATTGVFACLIFERLTKSTLLGLVGGVLTVAVLQCEIVQIFYDYVRIMDLCIYVSIFFFIRYLDTVSLCKMKKPRLSADVILGAVFATFASMLKQSSGLVFLAFCIAAFSFFGMCMPRRKDLLLQTGVIASVAAVLYAIMAVFLAANSSLSAYLRYNFISSVDAKGGGSIVSILFGWMVRFIASLDSPIRMLLALLVGALLCGIVALIVYLAVLSHRYPDVRRGYAPTFEGWAVCVSTLVLIASVTLPFLWADLAATLSRFTFSMTASAVLIFCALFFAAGSVALILKSRIRLIDWQRHCKYVFLSGAVFALGLAVGMSGGIAESQVALGYAFLPVLVASAAVHRKKEVVVGISCAAMLFVSTSAFARKIDSTYIWWGLDAGSYFEQTRTCDVPLLSGIKMSPEYAEMYNNVYYGVTENTSEQDEIFVFPHMPVLYLATDRSRATFTAVQWFDVSTDSAVISDIGLIREKRPKVMVLCSIGEYVISGHEQSFRGGQRSGLSIMQDFLEDFVVSEGYLLLSENTVSEGYTVRVWMLNE